MRSENNFKSYKQWKSLGYYIIPGEKSILNIDGIPVFRRDQVLIRQPLPKSNFPRFVFYQSGDNPDFDDYFEG